MTVSFPRASRLPATNFSTSNASPVASRLFSLSDTSPRQKSDERISVGRKCLRANVDFPAPEGPIRITRQSSGIVSFMNRERSIRSIPPRWLKSLAKLDRPAQLLKRLARQRAFQMANGGTRLMRAEANKVSHGRSLPVMATLTGESFQLVDSSGESSEFEKANRTFRQPHVVFGEHRQDQ